MTSRVPDWVIYDEYKNRSFRSGRTLQAENGLVYFITDYHRAKANGSVSLYREGRGALPILRWQCYRTKRHIDDPV